MPGGWVIFIGVVAAGLVGWLVNTIVVSEREKRQEQAVLASQFAARGLTCTHDGWGFTVAGLVEGIDWEFRYDEGADSDSPVTGRWQTAAVREPGTALYVIGQSTAQFIRKGTLGGFTATLARLGVKKARELQALAQSPASFEIGSDPFRKRFAVLAQDRSLAEAAMTPAVQEALMNWPGLGPGSPAPESFVRIRLYEKGLKIDTDRYVASAEAVSHLISLGVRMSTALLHFRNSAPNQAQAGTVGEWP